MIKRLLFIILSLISISAHADVVKGRVIDSQTKEPLEGARIEFSMIEGNSGQGFMVSTDSLGIFTGMSECAKTEIKISFIGYYDKTKRVVCAQGKEIMRPLQKVVKNFELTFFIYNLKAKVSTDYRITLNLSSFNWLSTSKTVVNFQFESALTFYSRLNHGYW